MLDKILMTVAAFALTASLAACGSAVTESEPTAVPEPTEETKSTAYTSVSDEVFNEPVETEELLGLWYNEENSASIQFNDDGTFINDAIEGTYAAEGNKLSLTYYGGDVTDQYMMGITEGQLVLAADDFQMIFDKQ